MTFKALLSKLRLLTHKCKWEHSADPGEEEHGKNPYRRRCACGREQIAIHRRFCEPRIIWLDCKDLEPTSLP